MDHAIGVRAAQLRMAHRALEDTARQMFEERLDREIEPEFAVELDSVGRSTGVEREISDEETIREPFDPEKIDVATRTPTVDLLLARIRRGALDLQPDFQRLAGIWTQQAQSRLIESMLLRLPLPTFYAAEADDARWVMVDGVQRLTAMARFIDPESIGAAPLTLKHLEYLGPDYEGKRFADLPGRLQTRLLETELVVHLIRQGTPEPVMFSIFARINTGGRPLTRQELRHALIPGPARSLLHELAESEPYQKATLGSVSPERMDDREMVLRFIAFRLTEPDHYNRRDFDDFLRDAMHEINRLSGTQVSRLREEFSRAMEAAREIFGQWAFRKFVGGHRRSPINKALFEAVAVGLARRSDRELALLRERREEVLARLFTLIREHDFERAISYSTGDIVKVHRRFKAVDMTLREVAGD
ncbi:DUF262 domain-containing protein [Microbispora sp. CA-135349]|uniref:DUF262 domain-containing protein n=1 Tax=Microbispora sp. CA-135349 TaxID=3239953 RepID=UPI003D8FD27B